MAILLLNQPFVSVGLPSYTSTIIAAGVYNLSASVTVPSAVATGSGAGSGEGLGSGSGGGGTGFVLGGQGLGNGGVGQGFGPTNGYPQPPAYGSNATSGPIVSSSLVITITQNGSNIYTSSTITPTQGELIFKVPILAAANDVIAVTFISANLADNQLNSIKSQVTLGQGM